MAQEDVDLLAAFQAKRYFIDEDHPTPMGNRLAAGDLAEYLHHKGLVDLDLPFLRQEQRRVLRRDPGRFTFRMPHAPQDVALTAYTFFYSNRISQKFVACSRLASKLQVSVRLASGYIGLGARLNGLGAMKKRRQRRSGGREFSKYRALC